MSDSITITRPDDWHVHFRQGETLQEVMPYTARYFGRGLVMPNTDPVITTAEQAVAYRQEITKLTNAYPELTHFEPVMTIALTPHTTVQTIADAAKAGVKAVKLYPRGATTNSHSGVELSDELSELIDAGVLEQIANCGMVLCIHAEDPYGEVLDREKDCIMLLQRIISSHATLRIVVEHVSTQAMAKFIASDTSGLLAATVTAHHLYLSLDDLLGDLLMPHYFCKPVVKTAIDQRELWRSVVYDDNFFFGSDSAPHPRYKKEAMCCSAGVYTAPILLPLLATMFERHEALEQLEAFVSHRGADFYGIERNKQSITLTRDYNAPPLARLSSLTTMPLRAGDTLEWQYAGVAP